MKQSFILFILVLSFFAVIAQPQKVVADKIIGIVGDKIILKSDITNEILDKQRRNEPVPDNAECIVMEQALALKALVLQAEKGIWIKRGAGTNCRKNSLPDKRRFSQFF